MDSDYGPPYGCKADAGDEHDWIIRDPVSGSLSDSPSDQQVGGDHYSKLAIQPMEYCHRNRLDAAAIKVIKYVTRWRDKDGIRDLKKALHSLEVWIDLEERFPTLKTED